MLTALALKATREAKVHQGIERQVTDHKYMATAPTVPAVRTAKFLIFLVAKRGTAIASVAGGNINSGFVNEFHNGILGISASGRDAGWNGQQKSPRGGLFALGAPITRRTYKNTPLIYSTGVMLTTLRFSAPLMANCT